MPIYKFTLPEVATDWVITIADGSGVVIDTIGVGASSGSNSVASVASSGNRLVISADLPIGEYRASSADVDSWGRRDFVTSGVLDIPATLDALPGTIGAVAAESFARRSQVPVRVPGVPFAGGAYAQGDRANTSATGTSRTVHVAGFDCTDLRVGYGNWAVLTGGTAEVDSASTYTVKASIKYGGTIYPLQFRGSLTVTIIPGAFVQSDPLGLDLPAGASFEVLTHLAASTSSWDSNHASLSSVGTGGFSTSDLVAVGSSAVADSIAYLYGPYTLTATPRTLAPVPSFIGIGDSILVGDKENQNVIEGVGGSGGTKYRGAVGPFSGFLNRAVEGKAGAYIIGRTGDRAVYWASNAFRLRRLPLTAGATYAVCNLGRNDINNGRTLANLQGDVLSLWRLLVARGVRVIHTTTTPQTTSTDSWATLANQTLSNAGHETIRVGFNAWLRDGAPIAAVGGAAVAVGASGVRAGEDGHPLSDWFEVADLVESARDSGKWKVNATANYYTSDGTHPTPLAYQAIGVALGTEIDTLKASYAVTG